LFFPKNGFRPTQQKVKEAMFSIIGPDRLQGHYLDLCCGTGALGLEAISRGAESVTMIDQDISYAKKNVLSILSSEDKEKVHVSKRLLQRFLSQNTHSFDVIFFDPPWHITALYTLALKQISGSDILKKGGVLLCESQKKLDLKSLLMPIGPVSIRRYGDAQLWVVNR